MVITNISVASVAKSLFFIININLTTAHIGVNS